MKKRTISLLIILTLILFVLNYNFLNNKVENFLSTDKKVVIERVIDGDTVVTQSGEHIRLLGINAPETSSNEPFSFDAKNFLNDLIQNKSVTLKFTSDKTDKYGRTLAYIFLNGKNVNVEMVENGLANDYFYSGLDQYSNDLKNAWSECLNKKINLCQKSGDICSPCFTLNKNYIENLCQSPCDVSGWVIKGEGRAKVILNGSINSNGRQYFNLSLENSGRSLFLRDSKGFLVNWGIY